MAFPAASHTLLSCQLCYAATSLPQNFYLSVFCRPYTIHTYLPMFTCDVAEGREAYTHGHRTKAAGWPAYHRHGWLSRASLLEHRWEQQPAALACQGILQANTKLSSRRRNQAKHLLALEIHCEKTKFVIIPFVRQTWLITTEGTQTAHSTAKL